MENRGESQKATIFFLGGLTERITNEALEIYFAQFGHVLSVKVRRDCFTGASCGFGFLTIILYCSPQTLLNRKHLVEGTNTIECQPYLEKNKAKDKTKFKNKRKLFIGGLPTNCLDEELRSKFEEYGPVEKAYVLKDVSRGTTRGFGFVVYSYTEDANRVAEIGWLIIRGKEVSIKHSITKETLQKNLDSPQYHQLMFGKKIKINKKGNNKQKRIMRSRSPKYELISTHLSNYRLNKSSVNPILRLTKMRKLLSELTILEGNNASFVKGYYFIECILQLIRAEAKSRADSHQLSNLDRFTIDGGAEIFRMSTGVISEGLRSLLFDLRVNLSSINPVKKMNSKIDSRSSNIQINEIGFI